MPIQYLPYHAGALLLDLGNITIFSFIMILKCHDSGGSRNSETGFQLIVNPKCRGMGAQPPAAEEVSIFKSIQCNEKFNIFPIDNSKLWLATLTYIAS